MRKRHSQQLDEQGANRNEHQHLPTNEDANESDNPPQIAIGYEDETLLEEAKKLATRLHLTIDNQAPSQLLITLNKLVLNIPPFLPLFVDFDHSSLRGHRDKKQGLVKACKPKKDLRVLDATAGWGRDAAVLAKFGADVLMLERNPIMAELLDDALRRHHAVATSPLKLRLIKSDALRYLENLSPASYPDVIYIDPMHPTRQKNALVKKNMQILQQLIGPDLDVYELIKLARTRALQKVVVKWPQTIPPLLPPTGSIEGKTVRFDLYSTTH